MGILVDYLCTCCGGRTESWVSTPAPASALCPACGQASRRAWSPVGLSSGAGQLEPVAAAPRVQDVPLCRTNPGVPGLCHMSPSAGRAWVARARGDGRALDRELERQEKVAAVKAPTLHDVLSPSHAHRQSVSGNNAIG